MDERPMLHGRARNAAIKTAVAMCSKRFPLSAIRVQLGKGTARSWATIRTPEALSTDEQDTITRMLIEHQLIGQYPDDMSNQLWPCVHFDAPRVR